MTALRSIALREWAATSRRPLLYVCAAVFFFLAFQTVAITSPTASGIIRIGRLWHNSPYVIAKLTTALSVPALFIAALLIAPTVQRDFHHRSHAFFLSLPIRSFDYLIGRFTGAFGAAFLVFLAAMAGIFCAAVAIPSEFTGPHRLIAFLQPLLLFAVPNLLLAGAICFAAATLSRSMIGVYVAAIVMMVVLGIGQSIADEALQKGMLHGPWVYASALVEPFGMAALQIVTATWSAADKNLRSIPIGNLLLVHRLVWSGVAVGLLAFTWRRFRRVEVPDAPRAQWKGRDVGTPGCPPSTLQRPNIPTSQPTTRQYAVLTMREVRLTVSHLAFVVLALATLANLSSNFLGNVRGQHVYPRTGFFLQHALHEDMFVILLTVFFAGVLVWREREHRSHEIFDSQPLSDTILYGSKLSALLLMQVAYAVLVIGYGVFVQVVLFRYTHLELGVYFAAVFGVKLLGWWAIAAAVFLLQAIAPNVYTGYAASALVIGASSLLPRLSGVDGLFRVGFAPPYVYSDMNGFGHFAAPLLWYRVYWIFVSVGLAVLAAARWPRGAARGRITRRTASILGAALLASIASAAVIIFNTAVPNEEALRAGYERAFRRFERLGQPSVDAVDLAADFFPSRRRLHLHGNITLRNTSGAPIGAVHVTLLPTLLAAPARLEIARPTARIVRNTGLGYTVFTFAEPLLPGQTATLRYDYDLEARGFSEDGHLVRNGSVVTGNDPESFPQIGYQSKLELTDPAARQRHGLPPVANRSESARSPSWSSFHATVSTDAEQQPVASGDRLREWTGHGRRSAEFAANGVVGTLFMLGSGAYARAAERVGAVNVEILYHPDHPYNLRRMLAGARCALQYAGSRFAPYPHSSLRIVELPAYTIQGNAQARPTVIVWGEDGGFITDVDRDAGIDRVFSTAAHEVGHQWWGSSVLTMNEVLADDVRVACLNQTFGQDRTVELLQESRSLYFRRRGLARDTGRSEPERPLRDGGQYDSGSILMWRLRRMLGEDVVNAALRDVVARFGYQPGPAPAPGDVAQAIKRRAPAQFHPLIDDTFDRITLHPIRLREARAVQQSDGRYRVTLAADLRKTYSQGDCVGAPAPGRAPEAGAPTLGGECEAPAPLDGYDDWIDVGVYDAKGRVLSLTTHRITDPRRDLELAVDGRPCKVVLDPLCTLLDADPSDNEVILETPECARAR